MNIFRNTSQIIIVFQTNNNEQQGQCTEFFLAIKKKTI